MEEREQRRASRPGPLSEAWALSGLDYRLSRSRVPMHRPPLLLLLLMLSPTHARVGLLPNTYTHTHLRARAVLMRIRIYTRLSYACVQLYLFIYFFFMGVSPGLRILSSFHVLTFLLVSVDYYMLLLIRLRLVNCSNGYRELLFYFTFHARNM